MARGRGNNNNQMAGCPACGADIYFRKRPRINQQVTCRQCSSLLEVLELSPLELDWAFEDPLDDGDWDHFPEEPADEEWDYTDVDEDIDISESDYAESGNVQEF